MAGLAPWLVLAPAAAAALLVFLGRKAPGWLCDAIALTACAGCAALAFRLLVSTGAPVTLWAGGWVPRHGLAVGIPEEVDRASLAATAYAFGLGAVTFLYGWGQITRAGGLYHALTLLLLTGASGAFLSADLFDLIVFLELAGVAAYGLAAYRIEGREPLQGGLNLAITGGVGLTLSMFGVALLYAHAGRLDLAGLGARLAATSAPAHPAAALLVRVALALVGAGLLIKAGALPFHFAHADAHATAPTPVLVLFSGVLLELGVFGLARVHAALGPPGASRMAALAVAITWIGAGTAVLAAVMSLLQRHLKRLLAYVAISHVGVLLAGFSFAARDREAARGLVLHAAGNGTVLAAAFLSIAVLISACDSAREDRLFGAGRGHGGLSALFAISSLFLAGLPITALHRGEDLMAKAAARAGASWFEPVLVASTVLTGTAALRAWARVFGGWGPAPPPADGPDEGSDEEQRPDLEHPRVGPLMLAALLLLLLTTLATGLVPSLLSGAARVAGALFPAARGPSAGTPGAGIAHGLATTLAAAGLAGLALSPRRAPGWLVAPWRAAARALHAVHSGHVGDYVAWLLVGAGALITWVALNPP